MTVRLLNRLRERRSFVLDDELSSLSRLDQAVAFVAALELAKHGEVELTQHTFFGPISVAVREVAATGEDADGDISVSVSTETEFQIA